MRKLKKKLFKINKLKLRKSKRFKTFRTFKRKRFSSKKKRKLRLKKNSNKLLIKLKDQLFNNKTNTTITQLLILIMNTLFRLLLPCKN